MKFEIVMTIWEDGQFRMRDRIEATDSHSAREEFELMMDKAEEKLTEQVRKRYAIGEDDDIPF